MHAVVRLNHLAPHGADLDPFLTAHAAQPGHHGTLTVDLGARRQLVINLWDSQHAAAAGRTAMTPIVADQLTPHLSRPSELLGAGPAELEALHGERPPILRIEAPLDGGPGGVQGS